MAKIRIFVNLTIEFLVYLSELQLSRPVILFSTTTLAPPRLA